jgi:gluconolactonase
MAPTLTIEGPVYMNDGSILVVEQRDCRLVRITPTGAIEPIAEIAGCPNGAAIGPDGAVYIANNGGMAIETAPDGRMTVSESQTHCDKAGAIDRVDLATGKVTRLYSECDGRKLGAPNDLVFDHNGGFWFTDVGIMNDIGITGVGSITHWPMALTSFAPIAALS